MRFHRTTVDPCGKGPDATYGPYTRKIPVLGREEAEKRAGRLGLSDSHICPQIESPVARRPATMEFGIGGRYCKLTCHVGIERPRGRREPCQGFTRNSRRRMMAKMAMIDQTQAPLPLFITLTYPESFPGDWETWKAHLQAFRKRFERRWQEKMFIIWKLELQERGAPHFHLMVYTERFIPYTWIRDAWYDIVGSEDPAHYKAGTSITRIRSARGAMFYISKYMAKPVGTGEGYVPVKMGRIWGVWNEKLAPMQPQEVVLLLSEFWQVRRVLNHYMEKHGRQASSGRRYDGMFTFIDSDTCWKILQWAGVVDEEDIACVS